MLEWKLGLRILMITGHPDDESYLASGMLYKNCQAGGKNFLICASLGERGTSKLRIPMKPAAVKKLRKHELLAVSRFLKISKCYDLNYPDGAVRKYLKPWLKKSAEIAGKHKPDVIVGFGPDGISGHLDHCAAHLVAKQLAHKLKLPFYMFTVPPTIRKDFAKWVKLRRATGKYTHNKLTYKKANCKVTIDPKVKLKALSFHKSQLDPNNPFHGYPAGVARELIKAEYFVLEN